MSTSWMGPLGGLPGLGTAALVGLVAVVGLICYFRAGPAPKLPPRRDVLEFCANQLAGAASRPWPARSSTPWTPSARPTRTRGRPCWM